MPRKKDETKSHLHIVGEPEKKSKRRKREYENEIPTLLDLEGDDKDYSVLLAEADKARADAAVSIQRYHVMKETEDRVGRINALYKRSLCAV